VAALGRRCNDVGVDCIGWIAQRAGGRRPLARWRELQDGLMPEAPRATSTAQRELTRSVRLSCSNLWKVYGLRTDEVFREQQARAATADDLITSLQARKAIIAVADVGFAVHQGESFVIMGLSGSGKSTLVRCLSRLVEPTAGQVLIDSEDLLKLSERQLIEMRRHKMGMVFQSFGLLPHLDVLDNVAYPLRVQGVPRAERERRARRMIELVGLAGREQSFPRELSGGMQQRVGIARSLAVEPDIWFLDEPFSALDPLIRRQMQDEFLRLQSVLRKTIVFITHDFLEALRLADRIAIMREGRIVQTGTPAELVLRPANEYVAEFTRDVPRAKIITAQAIAEPAANGLDPTGGVPLGTTIEALLPHLAGRTSPLPVLGADGRISGQVTADAVLAALASQERP
jgi:glycine betaine/proline transport system ATP-binding protein